MSIKEIDGKDAVKVSGGQMSETVSPKCGVIWKPTCDKCGKVMPGGIGAHKVGTRDMGSWTANVFHCDECFEKQGQ